MTDDFGSKRNDDEISTLSSSGSSAGDKRVRAFYSGHDSSRTSKRTTSNIHRRLGNGPRHRRNLPTRKNLIQQQRNTSTFRGPPVGTSTTPYVAHPKSSFTQRNTSTYRGPPVGDSRRRFVGHPKSFSTQHYHSITKSTTAEFSPRGVSTSRGSPVDNMKGQSEIHHKTSSSHHNSFNSRASTPVISPHKPSSVRDSPSGNSNGSSGGQHKSSNSHHIPSHSRTTTPVISPRKPSSVRDPSVDTSNVSYQAHKTSMSQNDEHEVPLTKPSSKEIVSQTEQRHYDPKFESMKVHLEKKMSENQHSDETSFNSEDETSDEDVPCSQKSDSDHYESDHISSSSSNKSMSSIEIDRKAAASAHNPPNDELKRLETDATSKSKVLRHLGCGLETIQVIQKYSKCRDMQHPHLNVKDQYVKKMKVDQLRDNTTNPGSRSKTHVMKNEIMFDNYLLFGPATCKSIDKDSCKEPNIRLAVYSILHSCFDDKRGNGFGCADSRVPDGNPLNGLVEDDLFFNIHEKYLHHEDYRTYVLFAKLKLDDYFRDGMDKYMSSFDEELYMTREAMTNLSNDQKNDSAYFPVSVLVVDESRDVIDKSSPMSQSIKYDPCIIIRLIATKHHLQRKGFGSILLAKYLDRVKNDTKYIYAITQMDRSFFCIRQSVTSGIHNTLPLTENMRKYYDDYSPPPTWSNYSNVYALKHDYNSDLSDTEEELDGRTTAFAYKNPNIPYMNFLEKLAYGFTRMCPHNEAFNNDEDDPFKLGYTGHLMVTSLRKGKRYKTSDIGTLGMKYPLININNNHIENIRYVKTNHEYRPESIDTLTFENFFDFGYFQTYNHMWHWTIVKRETLEYDESITGIAKAAVIESPKVIPLRHTGECRSITSYSHLIGPYPPRELPHHLRQDHYKLKGCCVWLSMALLLHHVGFPEVAKDMSKFLGQTPEICLWLHSFGLDIIYFGNDPRVMEMTKEQQLQHCICTSQTECLVIKKIGGISLFQNFFPSHNHLKWRRIKSHEIHKGMKNRSSQQTAKLSLKYLKDNEGYYIVFLNSSFQDKFHAVAVNSFKDVFVVYDSEEQYVLNLSMEVLNICCGPHQQFNGFTTLYKLTILDR